jgi:hypothetical protein
MNNIPISREYLSYDSRLLQMTLIAPTIKTADPLPRTIIKSPVNNSEASPRCLRKFSIVKKNQKEEKVCITSPLTDHKYD